MGPGHAGIVSSARPCRCQPAVDGQPRQGLGTQQPGPAPAEGWGLVFGIYTHWVWHMLNQTCPLQCEHSALRPWAAHCQVPTHRATPHCLKRSRARPPQHGDAAHSDRLQLSGELPGHGVGDLLYPLLPGAEPSAATSPARSHPLCTPQRLEGCVRDRRTSHRQQQGKLLLPAAGSRWAQLTNLSLASIHPWAAH